MPRFPVPLLLIVVVAPLATAQLPPVKLTISPAAEPKPALKYDLTVPSRDRVPGNAAHHYLRAVLLRPTPDTDRSKTTDDDRRLLKWDEMPLDQLPAAEVRTFLDRYKATFRELEHGSRCRQCEWAAAPDDGPDAVNDVVQAVPGYREIARLLALRAKAEIAENRFDAAANTLRTGVQFGKHLAEGPSLIQSLVGMSVVGTFLGRADEFVARPGAPNLYWAVTSLSRPLFDLRPALDGEDALNDRILPGLADLRKGPVTAEKALDVVEHALTVLAAGGEDGPFVGFGNRLAIAGYAQLGQAAARKDLIARGRDPKTVDAMPAVQAVFLNAVEAARELADDHRKWFLVPYPDGFDGLARATAKAKRLTKDGDGDAVLKTFLLVLPAVEKVYQSAARLDRKVALLRAVEAVRMHADAAGRPPTELADVKVVPVPPDPLTGQPFGYAVTDAGFTLTAPPAGTPPQKGLELRYEMTLRKGR
jgi:hypothetical protein